MRERYLSVVLLPRRRAKWVFKAFSGNPVRPEALDGGILSSIHNGVTSHYCAREFFRHEGVNSQGRTGTLNPPPKPAGTLFQNGTPSGYREAAGPALNLLFYQ
jgi:hypothetical protein